MDSKFAWYPREDDAVAVGDASSDFGVGSLNGLTTVIPSQVSRCDYSNNLF
jgi:hypothetical protein